MGASTKAGPSHPSPPMRNSVMPRRKKFGEYRTNPQPMTEKDHGSSMDGQAKEFFCKRGSLARSEGAVCTFAAVAVVMRTTDKFGYEAVGGDLVSFLMLVAVCWHIEGLVHQSPVYRSGADPGLLVGCTAVPALVVALMLRAPKDASQADLQSALFFLRLAVSCSGMVVVEAVMGDGRWGGKRTCWRDELRPTLVVLTLGGIAAMRFPMLAWPVPLAALVVAGVLMRALLRCSPRSFTVGEATLISTGITLLFVDWVAVLLSHAGRRASMPLARQLLPVDIAVEALLIGTVVVMTVMWPFVGGSEPPGRPPHQPPEPSPDPSHTHLLSDPLSTTSHSCPSSTSNNLPRIHEEASALSSHKTAPQLLSGGASGKGGGVGVGPSTLYSGPSTPSPHLLHRTSFFFVCLIATVGVVCLPPPSFLLGTHFVVWVALHVAETSSRAALLAYWLLVLGTVVVYMALVFPRQRSALPKTVVRKAYHILALLLFVPGQLLQPETQRLAYAAALALLCALLKVSQPIKITVLTD